jgi:hypothetical protein
MKTNNKETDNGEKLQDMIFKQMQRLSDPECNLETEIKRANALSSAATVIINSEKVKIDYQRVALQHEKNTAPKDKQLTNGKNHEQS